MDTDSTEHSDGVPVVTQLKQPDRDEPIVDIRSSTSAAGRRSLLIEQSKCRSALQILQDLPACTDGDGLKDTFRCCLSIVEQGCRQLDYSLRDFVFAEHARQSRATATTTSEAMTAHSTVVAAARAALDEPPTSEVVTRSVLEMLDRLLADAPADASDVPGPYPSALTVLDRPGSDRRPGAVQERAARGPVARADHSLSARPDERAGSEAVAPVGPRPQRSSQSVVATNSAFSAALGTEERQLVDGVSPPPPPPPLPPTPPPPPPQLLMPPASPASDGGPRSAVEVLHRLLGAAPADAVGDPGVSDLDVAFHD